MPSTFRGHEILPPTSPAAAYHLSEDVADDAIGRNVASITVRVSAPLQLGNDGLDIRVALSSPVPRDKHERARFRRNGTIQLHVEYVGTA